MSTDQDADLRRLAAADPAGTANPSPEDDRAESIRLRVARAAAAEQDEAPNRPAARPHRRVARRLVVVVAALTVSTAAMAVAERGPFSSTSDACDTTGRATPHPECGERRIADALARVEQNGPAYQRDALQDGHVDRAEYDRAAAKTADCMQAEYHQVDPRFQVTALLEEYGYGPIYAWRVRYPDGLSLSDLPWNRDVGGGVQEAPSTDPLTRCRERFMAEIDEVWQGQLIANQDG